PLAGSVHVGEAHGSGAGPPGEQARGTEYDLERPGLGVKDLDVDRPRSDTFEVEGHRTDPVDPDLGAVLEPSPPEPRGTEIPGRPVEREKLRGREGEDGEGDDQKQEVQGEEADEERAETSGEGRPAEGTQNDPGARHEVRSARRWDLLQAVGEDRPDDREASPGVSREETRSPELGSDDDPMVQDREQELLDIVRDHVAAAVEERGSAGGPHELHGGSW